MAFYEGGAVNEGENKGLTVGISTKTCFNYMTV